MHRGADKSTAVETSEFSLGCRLKTDLDLKRRRMGRK